MNCTTFSGLSHSRKTRGFTLVEIMVGVALGSMLLAVSGSLWLFGSRSFVAMGNYTDLDSKSRSALDLMSRELRQATGVTGYQDKGSTKWLSVTNSLAGTGTTYTWNGSALSLVCQKTGQPDQVYLTGCDRWDFQLFQRAPQKNGGYVFFPATNSSGSYDVSICKLINMSWKCSRTVLGSKVNTESVQTAQVVLRNKQ
jgi:prepilin-type N-terminal cleavage/methylation domain-containing protein